MFLLIMAKARGMISGEAGVLIHVKNDHPAPIDILSGESLYEFILGRRARKDHASLAVAGDRAPNRLSRRASSSEPHLETRGKGLNPKMIEYLRGGTFGHGDASVNKSAEWKEESSSTRDRIGQPG
jgi:hypothetical protein